MGSSRHKKSSVLSQLKKAVKNRDASAVIDLLHSNPDINKSQYDKLNLMHRLFRNVDGQLELQASIVEILKLLLNFGVDVDSKDKAGYTVLHLAIENRMKYVIQFLINCDANLDVRDEFGDPIIYFTIRHECKRLNRYFCDGKTYQQVEEERLERDSIEFSLETSLARYYSDDRTYQQDDEESLEKSSIEFTSLIRHFRDDQTNQQIDEKRLEKESIEFTRWMILKGLNVDCPNEDENTVLHYALKHRKRNFARLILEYCKNFDARDKHGNTALNIITEYIYTGEDYRHGQEDEELVRVLLSKGANVHKLNKDGLSPLLNAVANRSLNLLNMFKERGVDFCHFYRGGNLLHYFFRSLIPINIETYKAVFKLLINQGCDVNAKDKKGMTPLHFATRRAEPKVVEKLIERGANVNCHEFIYGYTPLHEAVEYNHKNLVSMLIKKGADVNAKTKKGRTPLHLVNSKIEDSDIPISPKSAKRLLPFFRGSPGEAELEDVINSRERTKNAKKDIITTLIFNGGNVDISDSDGFLPLQAAILSQEDTVIKELLRFGADINDNVRALSVKDYKLVAESICEHLVKMEVAELPVDKKLKRLLKSNDNFAEIHESCLDEVEELKNYNITEHTSLYELLHMNKVNKNSTCNYVKNVKLKKLIRSSKFKIQFPMYHALISSTYNRAVMRRKMLESAKDALAILANINRLPDLCTHEIFSYLSNMNLRNIIEGTRINHLKDK